MRGWILLLVCVVPGVLLASDGTQSSADPSPQMIAADPPSADPPADIRPSNVRPSKETIRLEGQWRLLLPAGFEHQVTVTFVEEGCYRIEPGNLNPGGLYDREGDRLLHVDAENSQRGQYVWKIRSPYLLTLVEQTAEVGSDYTSAVLFRSRGDREP